MPKSLSPRILAVLMTPVLLSACATAPSLRGPTVSDAETEGVSPYGLYLAGETALDDGRAGMAADLLAQASAKAPDAALLRERAFAAALLAGDVDRAASLAPPPSIPAAYGLGQITQATVDLADGKGRAAYARLKASTGGEHWAAATLLRPWAALAAGDTAAALEKPDLAADRAVQMFSDLNRARVLEHVGRFAEADAAYAAIQDRGGLFALAYGGFLERRGRRGEALALYDKALAKDPSDTAFRLARARAAAAGPALPEPSIRTAAAEALLGPAELLVQQKQPDAGLAYLRLALRLDPDLAEAWVLTGDALDADHDSVAARAAYARVPPMSAEYVAAQGRIVLDLQDEGDKAGAVAQAEAVAAARPDDPHALLVLAELYQDDARYADSVRVLDRLMASAAPATVLDWRLHYLRGAAYEREGKWPEGEADLQTALAEQPSDPEVLNYLGFAWADRGERLPEALKLVEEAHALDPESGAITDSLGWAHYRLGDYQAAVKDLERAASLDPSDPEVNGHLGDAYWRTGRKLEARYQWSRVLSLEPDAQARAAAQAKLANGLPPQASLQAAPARP
jgi:tetratricopeptide (TPR) repeat protein